MTAGAPTNGLGHLGRYELLERIASGRTTDVFLANSHGVEGFRRTVVIKRLRADLASDEAFMVRFLEQTRRLFTLSHANLVQVLDLDESDGFYFLTEEYVEGYDLAAMRVLASVGGLTLTAPLGLTIAAEVVKGIDYGHRRLDPATLEPLELAHGDLHPCNVLVGFEGQVKVNDFGLGPPPLQHDLSTEEGLLRAFSYAAPEVAAGEEPTQRSDLFALGLLVVEICRGHHPYRAQSAEAVREKAERGVVSQRFIRAVPEPLREFVGAALRRDPQERVVDLGAFYDRVIGYLHREHDYADANALAEFIHKIGDFDLGTAVVYSGMIGTTEHTGRRRVLTQPTLETDAVDDDDVWREEMAPPPARPVTRPAVPLPDEGAEPLGINGRPSELALLLEQPGRIRDDEVRVVFVSGPRGIGKSHLMRCAWRAYVDAGYPAAILVPDRDASARPYGAVLDLLALQTIGRPLLWVEKPADSLEAALTERDIGDARDRRLAAQLVELVSYDPHDRLVVRQALGRLVSDLIAREGERAGQARPFVLLLDGPEHADILSLELLHAVIANNAPGPLLLVVASLNKALLNQLGRAAEAERRTTLVLQPLAPEAIETLIEQLVGEPPSMVLQAAASGTPQWAIEVGLAQRFGQFEGQRPERLDHLRAHLGDAIGEVLAGLAIADVPIPGDDLAALLDSDPDSVRQALAQAAALHLTASDPYGCWSLSTRSLRGDCLRILDIPRQQRLRIDLAHRVAGRHRGNSALNRSLRARLKIDAGGRESAFAIGREHAHMLIRQGFTDVALSVLDGLAGLAGNQSVGAPGAALDLRLEQVQLALMGLRLERGRQILAQLPSRADEVRDEDSLLRALAQRARLALRRDEVADAELEMRRLLRSIDTRSSPRAQGLASLAAGELDERRGHLASALGHFLRAHRLLADLGNHELVFDEVRLGLAGLLVRRDEVVRIGPLIDAYDTPFGPGDDLAPRFARGYASLLAERPERARDDLETAFRTARRTGRPAAALRIAPELVAALVDVGAWEAARNQLVESQDLAARLNARRAKRRLEWAERYMIAKKGGPDGSRAQSQLNAARTAAESDANLTDALELAWLWFRATHSGGDVVRRLASVVGDRLRQREVSERSR